MEQTEGTHKVTIEKSYEMYSCTCCRWFKAHNVNIASERKQRQLAQQLIGDNVVAEKGAFSFPGEVIKEVPFVYIPNLIKKIADVVYGTHNNSASGLCNNDGAKRYGSSWEEKRKGKL